MISSFPCSSTTENASCTGSSGEFCLVRERAFRWDFLALGFGLALFLPFPRWDSVPILGEPRAESTPQGENICAFQRCQREFSYAIHLIRVSTTTNARPNFGQAISYASPLKVGVMS